MGEPMVGSKPKTFTDIKIEGSLVRWSPGLGGACCGGTHNWDLGVIPRGLLSP